MSLVKECGSAVAMGTDHYGGMDMDNDHACVSCQHVIENPSDIFGSCFGCAVKETGWDCVYSKDEDCGLCPSWIQSTKHDMTYEEYKEHINNPK
jgi:hypothetical protein